MAVICKDKIRNALKNLRNSESGRSGEEENSGKDHVQWCEQWGKLVQHLMVNERRKKRKQTNFYGFINEQLKIN